VYCQTKCDAEGNRDRQAPSGPVRRARDR
jgi:hypothetical protein